MLKYHTYSVLIVDQVDSHINAIHNDSLESIEFWVMFAHLILKNLRYRFARSWTTLIMRKTPGCMMTGGILHKVHQT